MNQDTISTLQIARSLLPGLLKTDSGFVLEEFLMWPPDLFALTSRILSFTGAYHNVVSPPHNREWPPKNLKCLNSYSTWQIEVRQIGLNWRKNLYEIKNFTDRYNDIRIMKITNLKKLAIDQFNSETLPKLLSEYWNDFTKGISEEDNGNIEDLLCLDKYIGNFESSNTDDNWRGFIALMSLHAIADEACAGWGIRRIPFSDSNKNNLIDLDYQCVGSSEAVQMYAENLLSKFGTLSHINNQRCRILPKRHTPHVGITLRSLSANLAYHRSSVDVKWTSTTGKNNSLINKLSTKPISSHINNYDSISVLLLPWPLHISPLYFQPFYLNGVTNSNDIKSFFKFHPDGNELDTGRELELGWEKLLDKTLENASHYSKVDILVLPECAISLDNLTLFEKILSKHKVPCYIIGVRKRNERTLDENMVVVKFAENISEEEIEYREGLHDDDIIQYKHHRWKLDRDQITRYNLGGQLAPRRGWWEGINIRKRRINFVNIQDKISICPLICEDLARQDPIADMIRTCGPSLVVTILMDGPQKVNRWPSKYASVLAEDPGSAVITLTSFGMVKRSKSFGMTQSKAIALWSDGNGNVEEIEMEEGNTGVLLNLCLNPQHDIIADGRLEHNITNSLILGGIHKISA